MSDRNWEELVKGDPSEIAAATTEWREEKGFVTGWGNFAEKLMLVVTELNEMNDAIENFEKSMDMLLNPKEGELLLNAACLHGNLANYAEEWVDAMVRTMDLAGACKLNVVIGERSGTLPNIFPLDAAMREVSANRFRESIRGLSRAMEAFRDVKLDESGESFGDGGIAEIEGGLSGVLTQCVGACQDLGIDWREIYGSKMIANEKRPSKHGRQR